MTTATATKLRDYQERTLEECREHVRAGRRAILIVLPTGAGKTRTATEFVTRHIERGGVVLWLAHRRELVEQARDRIVREGVPATNVRVVLAGRSLGRHDAPVTVASVQTLLARRKNNGLPHATLVVLDEAHHFAALQWRQLAEHYVDAIRLGLTATPERGDGTPLGDIFDALVAPTSVRELTERGYLVPCEVIAPPRQKSDLATDPVDAYQSYTPDGRAVVFCANTVHARQVLESFTAAGIPAAYVDGDTPMKDRAKSLAGFVAGSVRVLVNVFVATEGFDAPIADTCILARGCGAVGTYLQMVGRVLRPSPGKTKATLLDLRGVTYQHGLPDEDREFSLTGGIRKIASEKLDAIRTCLTCGAMFRPGPVACPKCATVLPLPKVPDVVRDTLVRVSSLEVASIEDKRRYFDRLTAEARTHGYKPGWVAHKFKSRFSHWPVWRLPNFQGVA